MEIKDVLSKSFFRKTERAEKKKPNRIIIFLILIAIVVLVITSFNNGGKKKTVAEEKGIDVSEYISEEERRLEKVLQKIDGAGDVSVFINAEGGGEKVLAKDSKNKVTEKTAKDGGGDRSEENENTVVTSGKGSDGEPYIIKEKMPEISGVLVVASGASSEKVKLEIYDAVKAIYGVAVHRIKVTY